MPLKSIFSPSGYITSPRPEKRAQNGLKREIKIQRILVVGNRRLQGSILLPEKCLRKTPKQVNGERIEMMASRIVTPSFQRQDSYDKTTTPIQGTGSNHKTQKVFINVSDFM